MTETTRIFRVVYYNAETEEFCQCRGSFWKTCPLRAANDLDCKESVISITPVDRSGPEQSESALGTLDPRLKNLSDKLKALSKRGFFK